MHPAAPSSSLPSTVGTDSRTSVLPRGAGGDRLTGDEEGVGEVRQGLSLLYIAGPMSGLPDSNYPAFHSAADQLRVLGYQVESPAENPHPPCRTWLAYMRMAVPQLTRCDAVVLLPGWRKSRGAKVERQLAIGLGLPVLTLRAALSLSAQGAGMKCPTVIAAHQAAQGIARTAEGAA